jgi:DNA-binding MarR family transcriptional regulator
MAKCPDDFIGRWFSVLHRSSISYMTNELKSYKIGSGQIMFLLELYYCDGINQEELSSFLSIDKANTTCTLQ